MGREIPKSCRRNKTKISDDVGKFFVVMRKLWNRAEMGTDMGLKLAAMLPNALYRHDVCCLIHTTRQPEAEDWPRY